ncbi:peptidylprolyl isomerase [Candidatus Falkowbacteria bacterium]|nr:peptidylprolyl isomerase [Candidatus Falkowbacteria bacterium]
MMRAYLLTAALIAALGAGDPAQAQSGMFAPVIQVNDSGITGYEIEQRTRFLTLLGAPGDVRAAAEKALIEDRLRLQAAKSLGVTATDQAVMAGMTEFAARANLSAEQFIEALGQNGVDPQTFRAFVEAGIIWRDVVRAKFGPSITVTDAEIDRALAEPQPEGRGARLLMSEIILPAGPGKEADAAETARKISAITTEAEFGAAARRWSSANSRTDSGKLKWLAEEALPEDVRAVVLALKPGQISRPIRQEGAILFFMMHEIEPAAGPAQGGALVDFARLLIPGGRSEAALAEAARLRGRINTCNDLYGEARNLPPQQMLRDVMPASQVPANIAAELARLDPGEVSTALTSGDALVFLMLCSRNTVREVDAQAPDRAAVTNRLRNARLAALADGWLADLMAEAIIRRP